MASPARVTGRLADMHGLTPMAETAAHADSHAVYRRLRAEWGEVAPVELEPGINAWLVMGYTELCQVLRQERLFLRDPVNWRDYAQGRVKPDSPLGPMMFPRANALFTDGATHRRLRAPLEDIEKTLSPRQMARLTREVCGSLIDGVAGEGRADLMRGYAMMVTVMVFGRMLGLDLETARELVLAQIALVTNSESAPAANLRSAEIITGLLQTRQAAPADDMTAIFTQNPNFETDDERMHSLTTTLLAAGQNCMAWIANTLLLMLTDERFSGRLRGGRLGLDDALDEVLWREPPLANMPARYAARDTVLAGQPISKGDALIPGYAAANDDPRIHSGDPWNELGNRSHLAWGAGVHKCPAEVPARVIVRTAVETALYQLPGLRLAAPADELGRIGDPWQRCPATLPVTFTPFAPTRLHQ